MLLIGLSNASLQMSKKYITSTASEGIMDTLEFLPHNSPMPQLSSTDRILMETNDMTDDLNHPHSDFTFNTVGEDTITAMTTLEAIFKIKYNKPPAPELIDSPINNNIGIYFNCAYT
jgi:hypothetical protein